MKEHTIALIKPDAFYRGLVGKVITRIEDEGFEIVMASTGRFTSLRAKDFYGRQHEGQPYYAALIGFMTSGTIMQILMKREDGIAHWRRIMGPADIKKRIPGQIRADYASGVHDTMQNLVHGSDSRESFVHECRAIGWNPSIFR